MSRKESPVCREKAQLQKRPRVTSTGAETGRARLRGGGGGRGGDKELFPRHPRAPPSSPSGACRPRPDSLRGCSGTGWHGEKLQRRKGPAPSQLWRPLSPAPSPWTLPGVGDPTLLRYFFCPKSIRRLLGVVIEHSGLGVSLSKSLRSTPFLTAWPWTHCSASLSSHSQICKTERL